MDSWNTENYTEQRQQHWPKFGNHIIAQFDETSIVVYQAFNDIIADYAVEHQWSVIISYFTFVIVKTQQRVCM